MMEIPEYIRISIGTAACLGLIKMELGALPTTAYLMLYTKNRCIANCAFCAQARESKADINKLSRIQWPKFRLDDLFNKLNKMNENCPIKRICIQVINYPHFAIDLLYIVEKLKTYTNLPISISCQPLKEDIVKKLYLLGIDRIGIPFDTATEDLFYKIKGMGNKSPYKWEKHLEYLNLLKKYFKPNQITTHLIVGLGETEYEDVKFIQFFKDMGINTGLFAFTPIKGTKLENLTQPKYGQYRRVQLGRYLIINDISSLNRMKFNDKDQIIDFGVSKEQLNKIILSGIPFQTSGCPNCNRPYYNERAGKKLYNFPKKLSEKEIQQVIKDLGDYT